MGYDGLLIATPFPPFKGGIQNYLYGLYSNLRGSRFMALTSQQPGSREFDIAQSLRITRVGAPFGITKARMLPLVVAAAGMVEAHRLNRVHCGVTLPDGLVGHVVKRLTGRPYMIYAYAMELYKPPKREALSRKILQDADAVVAISRFTRQRLLDLGVDGERIEMIPPGVDTETFSPRGKSPDLVKVLGLEGRKVILTAGRQVERKGTDTVIRALPDIVRAVPDVVYVVAGEGEYLPYLRKLTSGLGMDDYVRFVGSPPDEEMPEYYSICDVFATVNRTLSNNDCEGFGIVFLEAAACGRPVIGGNSGGAPDAVVDGKTGFLANPWDPGSVAQLITRLLNDDDLAREMGQAGRERAVQEFAIQKQAERLQELIARH